MAVHKYLAHYPAELQQRVVSLVDENRLAGFLLNRYPVVHEFNNDQRLRDYVFSLKNEFMKKSSPLSKVVYDSKIHVVNNALGLHSYVPRVQGNKVKTKNEIRISAIFKKAPEAFLKMIAVHELAHLKEKSHDKAFYRLCTHMLPEYHQLEFDVRVYLIQLELHGELY